MLACCTISQRPVVLSHGCEVFRLGLHDGDPIAVKDTLAHELLHLLTKCVVHERRLRCNLCHQRVPFLLVRALLEEDLGRLRENGPHQELDHFAAQVRRRRVQEVVINVREHARACAEIVERPLQAFGVGSVLVRRDGGVRCRDLEDDGRFLVCDGRLRDELVRESIPPREVHPDFGEAQLEELELAEVLIQEVPRSHVAASTLNRVLPTPLKVGALGGIVVWILSVRVRYCAPYWRRPVYILCGLLGYRDHRRMV